MTLKTSFIIGLAVATTVGVQTASAQSPDVVDRAVAARLATQSTPRVSPDVLERVVAAQQRNHPVVLRSDSVESAIVARGTSGATIVYPDVVDRAVTAQQRNLPIVHRYSDSAEGAIVAANLPTQPTSSGTEIEWPQIGIGFGVGIFLMLTLWLGFRATRTRQLAH